MSTPSEAVKTRTAARGWATRASNELKLFIDTTGGGAVDFYVLNDLIDQFDQRLNSLDNAQSAVELELDESALEKDIKSAADFRNKVRVPRLAAGKIVAAASSSPVKTNQSEGNSQASVEAKLPKLELPTFSGDATQWEGFWDLFVAVVDNSGLPEVTKFSYLLTLLKGDAKASVAGLSLSAANYNTACDILKKRYGRTDRIIFAHIQQLLNISVPKSSKVASLWKLQDELQAHVRSLESLGVTGEQYGVILTPLILSKLPPDIRLVWARDGEDHEGDLDFLLEFLQKEIKCRERSQTFQDTCAGTAASGEQKRPSPAKSVPSAAALSTVSKSRHTVECALCHKAHTTSKCWNLTKVNISERKSRLRAAALCFRCLEKDHRFNRCPAKCAKCQGAHHALLCDSTPPGPGGPAGNVTGHNTGPSDTASGGTSPDTVSKQKPPDTSASSTHTTHTAHTGVTCASTGGHKPVKSHIVLQTARVKVAGERGSTDAVVLFDTGSDRSYVSSKLVSQVGPQWAGSQMVAYAAFGSKSAGQGKMRNMFQLQLETTNGSPVNVITTEVPVICAPMYQPEVSAELLSEFGDLVFTDNYDGGDVTVDILIGLDSYWKLVTPRIVPGPDGLVAQETVFGWMVSGSVSGGSGVGPDVSHQLLCFNVTDACLRQLWDLEFLGISENEAGKNQVLEDFNQSCDFQDGRYVVGLPWSAASGAKQLQNNEPLAHKRLQGLTSKLARDPKLEQEYHTVIQDMESSGIVHEVPPQESSGPCLGPIFYMPHRPVVRESSVSTKVRPVFDASARGYNGVSLNDCMEAGPSMIPDLVEILIRFRRWLVALTADIQKAFLQIRVRKQDQDVHRFLWDDHGVIKIMRFDRVPFGNKASPFLLNATIKFHLSKFPLTPAVEELQDNLYVDDLISGADSDADGCALMCEASQVMDEANMNLTKWGSSSKAVTDMIAREFQDKHLEAEVFKVLGLQWKPSEDCFSFDGVVIQSGLKITKRVVLSMLARLFDPLGFLTPFTMTAKCLFQELWRLGLDWDEQVPESAQLTFTAWVTGLQELKSWEIPRNYTQGPWSDVCHLEIHGFGDASEKGYGACVYVRALKKDGTWSCSLVISKAKVSPIKTVTLPRLELMGSLLTARLSVFVRKALKVPDVEIHCWTDSTVALGWIRGDPRKWKTFVCNRVTEIQELTPPSRWNHCPGVQNPADLTTRGILAAELMGSEVWLHGPQWLRSSGPSGHEEPSEDLEDQSQVSDSVKCEMVSRQPVLLSHNLENVFQVTRWSSLEKSIRVVGWVSRFIHNLRVPKKRRSPGDLSFSELAAAKVLLIKSVQQEHYSAEREALQQGQSVRASSVIARLSPFLGSDGLLRMKGRLQRSELGYEEKHPVILPKCHLSLLLVRFQHQLLKHAGVDTLVVTMRNQFWIVGLRRLAKQVKRQCLSCQKVDAPVCKQQMAPFPEHRVTRAPPFAVTGVDHTGPLYCADFPSRKFYILLFTCSVVRAVHLELVDSLALKDTVLAIRRFVARRGLPTVIWSDNARVFGAAKDELRKQLGDVAPEWKFIAPRAPWWGGWWERLMRPVKAALKKSCGSQSLTRVELETCLHEAEACLNSRPLTFVGDDPEASDALTPAHFLIGRTAGFQAPVPDVQDRPEDLQVRKELVDMQVEQFWSRWSSEYLRNLPACCGSKPQDAVNVGSVVLIHEDGVPRMRWLMGVVQQVFPGKDGLVRAVLVKTPKGSYTRPIQRLHNLEIMPEEWETSHAPQTITDIVQVPEVPQSGPSCADSTKTHLDPDPGSSPVPVSDGPESDAQTAGKVSRYGRKIKPKMQFDM